MNPLSRRAFLGVGAGALALAVAPSIALAEDAPVPVELQMKLLVKVAGYDRHMADRAGSKVRVAIVQKAGDADAERIAGLARTALADYDTIADLPAEISVETYSSAKALKALVADQKLSIVYFTTGFDDAEVDAIASALDGADVLSACAAPAAVPHGVVLGFDLVSGKPKLLLQLTQAKKQSVQLPADVIKLAKVYE